MIAIRTDFNEFIGMGHLTRCLSIYSELKNRGEETLFIISNDSDSNLLVDLSINVQALCSNYYSYSDSKELLSLVKRYSITTMLIDSYFVCRDFFDSIELYVNVFYLDDLHSFDYNVRGIINYDVSAKEELYSNSIYKTRKLYLGLDYFPLKPELRLAIMSNREYSDSINQVLITTGATDPESIMADFVMLCDDFKDVRFFFLLGCYYLRDYIEKLNESSFDNAFFLEWGQEMSSLYLSNDLVICPGSTTLYEALSLGTPCISYQFADNHGCECRGLDKINIAPFLGDIRIDRKEVLSNAGYFIEMLKDKDRRRGLVGRARRHLDGNGASRIAELLMNSEKFGGLECQN